MAARTRLNPPKVPAKLLVGQPSTPLMWVEHIRTALTAAYDSFRRGELEEWEFHVAIRRADCAIKTLKESDGDKERPRTPAEIPVDHGADKAELHGEGRMPEHGPGRSDGGV